MTDPAATGVASPWSSRPEGARRAGSSASAPTSIGSPWTGHEVRRLPKSGGTPATLASGQLGAWAIATDGAYLYWTTRAGGTVSRMLLRGGAVEDLSTFLNDPLDLVLDGTTVYFTDRNAGQVLSVPKAGGFTTLVASIPQANALTKWGNDLYVTTDQGHLYRVTLPGPTSTLAHSGMAEAYEIASNATGIYWCSEGESEIWFLPHGGGTPASFGDGTACWGVFGDEATIYWSNEHYMTPNGMVRMAPVGGGAEVVNRDGPREPHGHRVRRDGRLLERLHRRPGHACEQVIAKVTSSTPGRRRSPRERADRARRGAARRP